MREWLPQNPAQSNCNLTKLMHDSVGDATELVIQYNSDYVAKIAQ